MTKEEIEAAKAAFLAKGNQITVVKEGEGAGLTARDWYEARRTPGRFDAKRLGQQITEEDAERAAENRFQRGVEENGYYKS